MQTVKQLARLLGRFHSLKSPISCNGFKQWEKLGEDMDKVPGADDVMGKKYQELIQADPELKEKFG